MKKTTLPTWEFVLCLLVCLVGGYVLSYIITYTKAEVRAMEYWDSIPHPIRYIDTCASYQPHIKP